MAKEKDNIRKDNAADDDYLELLKTVGSKAEASSQNEEASKEKNKELNIYSKDVEDFLADILSQISENDNLNQRVNPRWRSIKLLEEDQ